MGDVHRRGSALAKAAAESDVDVGGGGPLAPYANDGCSRRGCTGSAYYRLRHSVVRGLETASEPGGTRWTGGGTAELLRASRSAPAYLEPFLQKTIEFCEYGLLYPGLLTTFLI